ncbi:hypothetical protein [Streptomyces sp. NPDC058964]|uniref:hypothetical protein n=1 Tax=Streptomyces sp. NPDC058964 TaxID=3346681 RepID=UPI0036B4625A
MAAIDALGIVTGWSEDARLPTGHPAEQVVGRPVTGLLDEEVPRGPSPHARVS